MEPTEPTQKPSTTLDALRTNLEKHLTTAEEQKEGKGPNVARATRVLNNPDNSQILQDTQQAATAGAGSNK